MRRHSLNVSRRKVGGGEMKMKTLSPSTVAAVIEGEYDHLFEHPNSTIGQALRILHALVQGPQTTFDLRDNLNIPHPAGRIHQLKYFVRIRGRRVRVYVGDTYHDISEYRFLGVRDE
jgi:hypothetical protein